MEIFFDPRNPKLKTLHVLSIYVQWQMVILISPETNEQLFVSPPVIIPVFFLCCLQT